MNLAELSVAHAVFAMQDMSAPIPGNNRFRSDSVISNLNWHIDNYSPVQRAHVPRVSSRICTDVRIIRQRLARYCATKGVPACTNASEQLSEPGETLLSGAVPDTFAVLVRGCVGRTGDLTSISGYWSVFVHVQYFGVGKCCVFMPVVLYAGEFCNTRSANYVVCFGLLLRH